jgi:hypothetical protein
VFGPPTRVCIFLIRFSDGTGKHVDVRDWNRAGAWATLCRDLTKNDHGNTNKVESISLVTQGTAGSVSP